MLTIGSLFSGIGGLELGLEMAGFGPVCWQVEKDPFRQIVLAKHWPNAERFADVCTVGAGNLVRVGIVCGGFPCQDVSGAGKGAGLAGERSGLWREFARVVGEIRPGWVVVENVKSGAGRWLDAVARELEELGYAALPVPVSARDVGAPHIRERLFIVARAADVDRLRELQPQGGEPEQRGRADHGALADSDGLPARQRRGEPGPGEEVANEPSALGDSSDFGRLPREPWRSSGERDAPAQPVPGRDSSDELPAVCPECCRALIDQGLASPGPTCPTCRDPLFGPDRRFATDPDQAGREGARTEAHEGWAGFARDTWRSPQSGLVPLVHGLSGGLAGRRRRARIRALGDTVVPQCAEVVGYVIRELIES